MLEYVIGGHIAIAIGVILTMVVYGRVHAITDIVWAVTIGPEMEMFKLLSGGASAASAPIYVIEVGALVAGIMLVHAGQLVKLTFSRRPAS